jgi:hypothetical protein
VVQGSGESWRRPFGAIVEADVRGPDKGRAQRHASDHATDLDGTIAFTSRDLDAPAVGLAMDEQPRQAAIAMWPRLS